MPSNRGVVHMKPGKVEVQKIDFPTFHNPAGEIWQPMNIAVVDGGGISTASPKGPDLAVCQPFGNNVADR
ncbi:MAG TPA: hypothetical protein VHT04_04410 [Stellaceae bacterium]|jgi:hypothetical protein|nr:hypothetical protein [Stellaceae bacterium]